MLSDDEKLAGLDVPHVLVEGPNYGHADFFRRWFAKADEANRLWTEAKRDKAFAKRVERLEVVYLFDFFRCALVFFAEFRDDKVTFTISLHEQEIEFFAVMVEMGFFVKTGRRYQTVVPSEITAECVKNASLKFAQTEDADFVLHPEHLLEFMPLGEVKQWQKRLRDMNELHRIADRALLLDGIVQSDGQSPEELFLLDVEELLHCWRQFIRGPFRR